MKRFEETFNKLSMVNNFIEILWYTNFNPFFMINNRLNHNVWTNNIKKYAIENINILI